METVLLTVTLLSLGAAVAAGVLSWRVMRQDRLRSEARIAALAGEIETDDTGDPGEYIATEAEPGGGELAAASDFPFREENVAVHDGLFSAPPERTSGRLAAVAAAGVLVVTALVGVLALSGGDEAPGPQTQGTTGESAVDSAPDTPLELIALGHERESDRLTVRGVVRGAASKGVASLTAVVLLFDRDGEFIASGRAQVGDTDAAPGNERRFVVSVPAGAQVGRYRISFRGDDDHIVPHVDKRNPVI